MKHFRLSWVLLMGYLGFISLGLPDGVLGVAWPSIRRDFGVPLSALGPFFVVGTVGYLISSFNSGRAVTRLGVGLVLAVSSLLTALSLLGFAFSPAWWVMVSICLLAGFGAGAVDSALNTYMATNFTARHVTWLHACWGVGAATGPAIMTAVLRAQASWRWGYIIIMLIQLILTAGFFATTRLWVLHPHDVPGTTSQHSRRRHTLRRPATWLSIALFFIYCGIEISTGQWMYSLLVEARNIPVVTAGLWISFYWGSLTAGRFLIGAAANHIPPILLLRLSMSGALAGLGLIALNLRAELSLAGLILTGFSLAPIFPSLMATTPRRMGAEHTANAVGFQVARASLGLATVPGVAGLFAQHFGLNCLPGLLIALTLFMILLHEALIRAK